jgi:hypothetical protein
MLDLVVLAGLQLTTGDTKDTVFFLPQGLSLGLAYCMYGVSFDPRNVWRQ